ncbi:unnamed protein product [Rotaria sp. Silwood1]|nr:unnamed protein product [Rotaria sp. Silwood1]
MPSSVRRTSIGATCHKQYHDNENFLLLNYSIKPAYDHLGYDYRYSIEEKRPIDYTDIELISSKESTNKYQISSLSLNEYQCTYLTTINNEIHRSSCHLPYLSTCLTHKILINNISRLKQSQIQMLNVKLDDESFDRNIQIHIRESIYSDLFSTKIFLYYAVLQRSERILNKDFQRNFVIRFICDNQTVIQNNG